MLSGFKNFILRGNVVDMAVGVVIGAAFGGVVAALDQRFAHAVHRCARRQTRFFFDPLHDQKYAIPGGGFHQRLRLIPPDRCSHLFLRRFTGQCSCGTHASR